jgi:putative ABC transport system permease protein
MSSRVLSPHAEHLAGRAFGALLLCYPAEFRHEYAREMALVFVDRCRAQCSLAGLLAVWLNAAAGVLIEAPKEHGLMILQDLTYAVRMLRKDALVTAIAVAVLALGIGATTTIFSLANGLLLRPLPYPDPERLVAVDESAPQRNDPSMGVAFPNYQDMRARNGVFEDLAVYTSGMVTLTGGAEAERVSSGFVSDGVFRVLGVKPLLGRTFLSEEDVPKAPRTVLLGYDVWQRRYSGDRNILGKSIRLSEEPVTVVGVMPRGFNFPDRSEMWLPLQLDAKLSTRTDHYLGGIARLKPDTNRELAEQDMRSIMRQIATENPVTDYGQTVNVISFRSQITTDYRNAVLTLLGAVGFVLLIAAANVANLLLVKASSRTKEMAIRGALGASRGRMMQQMVVESMVLGGLGAAVGLTLAVAGIPLLLALIPVDLPLWMHFEIDSRVLWFTLAVTLSTSLLFGLVPALASSRVNLTGSLKEGGRTGSTGERRRLVRDALVVVEVALSLVLLTGAGLMIRSFLALSNQRIGFDADNVLTFRVSSPEIKYPRGEKGRALVNSLREQMASLPGVTSVAAASFPPLANTWGRSFTAENHPTLSLQDAPMINHTVVTPGYFRTLGVPIIEGRDFTEADGCEPLVTIVDQALARQYWRGQSAIGKRVRFGPPEANEPWHTVVGVAGEVRNQTLTETGRKSVYLPYGEFLWSGLSFLMRTAGPPLHQVAAVRARVTAIDRDVAASNFLSMQQIVTRSIWQQRFFTTLFLVFAILALMLAAVGLYGVMSYAVSQRTHELGIRMALGASGGDLQRMVMRQALVLALAGVGLGGVAAMALMRVMRTQLYHVSPTDPATFAVVAVVLAATAALASYFPARHATRVDPVIALREG